MSERRVLIRRSNILYLTLIHLPANWFILWTLRQPRINFDFVLSSDKHIILILFINSFHMLLVIVENIAWPIASMKSPQKKFMEVITSHITPTTKFINHLTLISPFLLFFSFSLVVVLIMSFLHLLILTTKFYLHQLLFLFLFYWCLCFASCVLCLGFWLFWSFSWYLESLLVKQTDCFLFCCHVLEYLVC